MCSSLQNTDLQNREAGWSSCMCTSCLHKAPASCSGCHEQADLPERPVSTFRDDFILDGFTIDDLDRETLCAYRKEFEAHHPSHPMNALSDQDFLEGIGAWRKDRRSRKEGLTCAGLLMFGRPRSIREAFSRLSMTFLELNREDPLQLRQSLRMDGTWPNNLYTFFHRASLCLDQAVPHGSDGIRRVLKEAQLNMIVHADYEIDGGLKIVCTADGILFSNPGVLKHDGRTLCESGCWLSVNPTIARLFGMAGYGQSLGLGLPEIRRVWKENGWSLPVPVENRRMRSVELKLTMSEAIPPALENQLVALVGESRWQTLSEDQKSVLVIALEEGTLCRSVLVEGLEITLFQADALLAGLCREGLLRMKEENGCLLYALQEGCTCGCGCGCTERAADETEVIPPEKLNETDRMILGLFAHQDVLTLCEVKDRIPTLNSIQSASKAMKRLCEKNCVCQSRKGRTVYFRLSSNPDAAQGE